MEDASAPGRVTTAHTMLPDATTVVMDTALMGPGTDTAGAMDTAEVMATEAATAIDPASRLVSATESYGRGSGLAWPGAWK